MRTSDSTMVIDARCNTWWIAMYEPG